jgi:hypothetical protein
MGCVSSKSSQIHISNDGDDDEKRKSKGNRTELKLSKKRTKTSPNITNPILTKASIDEIHYGLLCCHLCNVFINKDLSAVENMFIDHFNVKLTEAKEWKSGDDFTLARAITGFFQSVDNDMRTPFVVFEMKYVQYDELKRMTPMFMYTSNNFSIGKAGNLCLKSYEALRSTGIIDWIADSMNVETPTELVATGFGLGGTLASLLIADVTVVTFKERLGIMSSQRVDIKSCTANSESNKSVHSKSSQLRRDSTFNQIETLMKESESNQHDRPIFPYFAVTFGSPRIFSHATVQKLNKLRIQDNVIRFINSADPLPSYPKCNREEYSHLGSAVYYEDSTRTGPENQYAFIKIENDDDFDGESSLRELSSANRSISLTVTSNESTTLRTARSTDSLTDYSCLTKTDSPHNLQWYISQLESYRIKLQEESNRSSYYFDQKDTKFGHDPMMKLGSRNESNKCDSLSQNRVEKKATGLKNTLWISQNLLRYSIPSSGDKYNTQ